MTVEEICKEAEPEQLRALNKCVCREQTALPEKRPRDTNLLSANAQPAVVIEYLDEEVWFVHIERISSRNVARKLKQAYNQVPIFPQDRLLLGMA